MYKEWTSSDGTCAAELISDRDRVVILNFRADPPHDGQAQWH